MATRAGEKLPLRRRRVASAEFLAPLTPLLPFAWRHAVTGFHGVTPVVRPAARSVPTWFSAPRPELRWSAAAAPATSGARSARTRRRGKGPLHTNPTGGIVLDEETTKLHQKYHDATVNYVAANFEWVNTKKYGIDSLLSPDEQAKVWRASRDRLFQWPRLTEKHMHKVDCARQHPQQFSPQGADAEALGDPGENVFVINLPRRPAKLRHVLHQLHQHGISATIVDAIDGDVFTCQEDFSRLGVSTLPGYCGHANTLPHLTSGQLGCFMSHFAIWHYMVEKGIQSALILEDDFDLQEDFSRRLAENLKEANAHGEDWNLMYLGRSPTEGDWRRVSEHIVEPGYTLWTVAYILRLEAAKVFVEEQVQKRLAPLDHYFSVSMGKGLDLHWNEQAIEWSAHIPPVLRGLAMTPPLVMPNVASMILSDTAMLRNGTKYVTDLPEKDPAADLLEQAPPH